MFQLSGFYFKPLTVSSDLRSLRSEPALSSRSSPGTGRSEPALCFSLGTLRTLRVLGFRVLGFRVLGFRV